ncbi:hypothetical protein FA15DRAFT_665313 [Coprinopsis marcescibilis]|uniref:Uncharacterized protein n=1 Tax=Coprinopsis marcescibilis TaxID=230819 RepID=A0A5C3L6H6_COPMA|nr:hypothetical protein FA15DRAFT_665313 [Coprinopsis marcescibilis]
MSASARAEARRKAILSRGSDRLAKLTTSARGEDAGAYIETTSSRSTSRSFLGEESNDMPTPKAFTPSPSPSPRPASQSSTSTPSKSTTTATSLNPLDAAGLGGRVTPDPSVWSPEQQQQFIQALMGASAGAPGTGQTPLQSPLGDPEDPIDPTLPPLDNPLAAMLFGNLAQGQGGFPGAQDGSSNPFAFPPGLMNLAQAQQGPGPVQKDKPKTRLQKLMPVVHLLAVWSLLAYFVLWFEPKIYAENGSAAIGGGGTWSRWARLLREHPVGGAVSKVFGVQTVPFFWAFLTVEVLLHSTWIFSKSDAVRPPTLVALALPHLPPPIPSIIINSLKYIRMISAFLDDIAGLIVGLGFIVYFAGLFAS